MSGHWYLDGGIEPQKTPEELREDERKRNWEIGERIREGARGPYTTLLFLGHIGAFRSDSNDSVKVQVQMLKDFSPDALATVYRAVRDFAEVKKVVTGKAGLANGPTEETVVGFVYAVPLENEPADVWLDRTIQLNTKSEKK